MLERIGEIQRIPVEETTTENLIKKYALYVDWSASSGKIASVKISNRDEASAEIIHEITIDGKNGIINRALVALSQALEKIKSIEEEWKSRMTQEIERLKEETGGPVIPTPILLIKEGTPAFPLPEYGLWVRRSRYGSQSISFIVKGTEIEDIAKEPPFKIGVEGEGDFVSISIENIQPLVEELTAISNLPSL